MTTGEPDRDRTLGPLGDPRLVHAMPVPFEVDRILRPQLPHQRHLLFLALAAVVKILVERLVLHGVPAGADA